VLQATKNGKYVLSGCFSNLPKLTTKIRLNSYQKPMACGIVLQMDQTTPVHQVIFRSQRQCRAVANLDRDVCLPTDLDGEKAAGLGALRLRNPTNINCIGIHQIAALTYVFE
jgi:hypothetical protein